MDFNAMDLATATATDAPAGLVEEELFDDLVLWLVQEGFITVGQSAEGNAFNVALTSKSCIALRSMPKSLQEPLGRRLKSIAKETASQAGRQAIASAVTMALGAAFQGG